MDVRFHLSQRMAGSVNKSKHSINKCLNAIKQVLKYHPDYGVPIPGFSKLRKMRVAVPHLKLGKSGGYRMIYRRSIIDEIQYIVLLETYFKGDKEDLTDKEYQKIIEESDTILDNPLNYEWEDPN